VFENATVQPSPLWLQYRLQAVGLNPINNIVDVTNFVMAELGQPMHAFDADKLAGPHIIVRTAREGERIEALNGESYDLTPAALVIADEAGPIALAGVIGGAASAISDGTTRLVFESASFHAATIRRTSSRLRLRTDASMRFEKAQDPVNTVRGLARAVELLQIVSPGIRLVGGLADAAGPVKPAPRIELAMEWLIRKLGRTIDASEVRTILESLQFTVEDSAPGVFTVTVPSWRATKDVSIKEDLVEEIGRTVGYATITPVAPEVPTNPPVDNPRLKFHRQVRAAVAAQGYTEVYNYSFLNQETAQRFGWAPEEHIGVANPISSEQGLLRLSLVPGIWRNVQDNAKYLASFGLFEVGYEIHKREGSLPDEVPHLVAAVYERDGDTGPFYEAKRLAECLLPGCEWKPGTARSFEHPSRVAEVEWRGCVVGRLFELHPEFVEGRAALLDLDLGLLEEMGPVEKRYKPLRRFPSSEFDLSVVTGMRSLVGEIEKQIVSFAGPRLENIRFLRQYSGAPLPEDAKSVSFRLLVAAQDRTLSSEEVSGIRDGIIQGMRGLGYEMRV
jgi:phenylalanyl-tRNA synthetase beta chain